MARSRSRIRFARLIVQIGLVFGLIVLLVALWLRFSSFRPYVEPENAYEPSPTSGKPLKSNKNSHRLPVPTREIDQPHPLDPVLELARSELAAFLQNVVDYSAVMLKRERIGGKLGEENRMLVKIINRRSTENADTIPLHVYLRFESPSSLQGREVIWVEGKNDNKLIAHEAGIFNLMSVKLPPDGTLAMMGNKYPITGIGMANLYTKLIEKGERDRKVGKCEVTIRDRERLDEIEVRMIEVKHPEKQAGFDFHIARIYLDMQRHLPVRYESYLWPVKPDEEPPLEEQYTYQDIQLNVGLTELDFDEKNPAYQFPK